MRSTWFSPRAILLHLLLVVLVPTFAALCDWQVHRALSGNELSWAYVFEWPFFGAYAIYMWWRFLHEPSAPPSAVEPSAVEPSAVEPSAVEPSAARLVEVASINGSGTPTMAAVSDTSRGDGGQAGLPSAIAESEADEELAAYNRYLARLDAGGDTKHW